MLFKLPIRFLKSSFRNLYLLMFLNGFLLASIFYFHIENAYESTLFLSLKDDIDLKRDADDNQDSLVVKAMTTCHAIMGNRASMFSGGAVTGTKADFFGPASVDLMTTRGACGSYSEVLARILQTYNLPVRIAQMKANGVFAAHNIVEVKLDNEWAVLDPTFNAYFVRPDSHLASFADVKGNWAFYSKQVPAGYDLTYRFEDVRYTNWTKIPVLLPGIKAALNFFMGTQKADTISMRSYFLDIYAIYFYLTLFIYLPLFLFTFSRFVRTQVFPDKNIPLTVRNIIKYLKPRFVNMPYNRIQSS
jgi:hypothetical protein